MRYIRKSPSTIGFKNINAFVTFDPDHFSMLAACCFLGSKRKRDRGMEVCNRGFK